MGQGKKRRLVNQIIGQSDNLHTCRHCDQNNHTTEQCWHLGKECCSNCGYFGHSGEKCHHKISESKATTTPPQKKQKVTQVNQITEIRDPQEDEESEQGDVSFNLESYDPSNYDAMDDCIIYYWLADSATTSHITNQWVISPLKML